MSTTSKNNSKTGPTPIRPTRTRSGGGRRWGARIGWILGILAVVLIVIPSLLAEMITDWMWFSSQNLAEVYTTRLWLAIGVFFGAAILAVLLLYLNWMIAWRITRPASLYPGQRDPIPVSRTAARWITISAAVVLALFLGAAAAGEWPTILLNLNGGAFGQTDPVFNNDIGFYVFELPFLHFLRGWFLTLVVIAGIGTAIIYGLTFLPQITERLEDMQRRSVGAAPQAASNEVRLATRNPQYAHLTVLGAVFLLLIAAGYWLDRYDLLYSSRAVAYGAGYTDVNARLPALNIMMVIAVLMAVLLLVNIRIRTWRLLVGALGAWLLALVIVGVAYPAIIQQFVVKPSESELERPYIINNIEATRAAYGLDKFSEHEVPAVQSVTRSDLDANPNIVDNIRLWDYRPLLDTYGQLQEIRSYYDFGEVDIDRYTMGGSQRQVMVAAREIDSDQLASNVRTWENLHFRYTHGYGMVASPVNEIVGEGLPNLLVKDIPPVSSIAELNITRPELYYGEETNEYVFVNSSQVQEFDYPLGDQNKFVPTGGYSGGGGVEASGFFNKLLMAVRFGDGNILISPYITPGTRILFHRNIHDMVRMLAPFLSYDGDPYVVVVDGKMYWIQDAFTYTDRYPYSAPYGATEAGGINYIRNSVKVVIDAYSGQTTYYIADAADPIVRAYSGIFPALFKDISTMPAGLRAHLRYPEDLMNIQTRVYSTFHMTDPQVFYTKEDVWELPSSGGDNSLVPPEAYYVNIQLPGTARVEFMLIQSFSPRGRDNMIAWMAARSDPDSYGKVDVIRYPKQQLIYGPRQIEARIDQDPVISQQLTLWRSSGSDVIRGNLLTIPISNTVLYVEPLFLQATTSKFPELKRIIVATGDSVGIGADLDEALDVAFKIKPPEVTPGTGGTPPPSGTPTPGTGGTPPPSTGRTPEQLTQSALDHYNRAQDALTRNDWTTYGQELDSMKGDLDELASTYGVPTPTPSQP
jgi:uncharacterized protein